MRAGRIITTIIGALLTVVGFGALAGGGVLVAVYATQRDDAGWYQTSAQRLETSTAVLVARADITPANVTAWPHHPLGTVRINASSANATQLFIGIAPAAQVDRWLAGTRYERVAEVGWGPLTTRTQTVAGTTAVTPPGGQTFWVASVTGTGQQQLTWLSERGEWAVVVMNADARPGVVADVSVGTNTGVVLPVGIGLLAGAVVLLGIGIALMVAAVSRAAPATVPAVPAPGGLPGTYPVRLDARLDPELSRWLWLLKWALAIPHYFVLALLWLAVVPLTIVAGFAILVTGRYPRSIFEFNVGVMRWTWRVSYYAFGALATDRYPPFSLDSDPSYPADLSVDYPQQLSRGLVLIKWWLLALPHYLVVAVLLGGWTRVGWNEGPWWYGVGAGGLIGLLAVVAAIILLVGGRYPGALFDVVVGMNRWCYRVFAYAGLMRDEYPPFRFDGGGADPGTVPAVPTPPPPPPANVGGELVSAGRS